MSPRIYAAWCFVVIVHIVAFMQRMAPQSINHQLIADFNVAATGMSVICFRLMSEHGGFRLRDDHRNVHCSSAHSLT